MLQSFLYLTMANKTIGNNCAIMNRTSEFESLRMRIHFCEMEITVNSPIKLFKKWNINVYENITFIVLDKQTSLSL